MSDSTDLSLTPAYTATMDRLEALKRVSAGGTDYWMGREICSALGYTWEGFGGVIQRARDACAGVNVDPSNHFRNTSIMVALGSGAHRKVPDVFLSRAACYLIAMNGDPAKPEIAAAQAYFTVQTRRMERRDREDEAIVEDERRLELRGRVKTSFKKVSAAAKGAGVRDRMQPVFHDARYKGLYGAPRKVVQKIKGLSLSENLLDRAGPLELSANDFQMNLATEVINREGIRNEQKAITRNEEVGARVRQVIVDSGSPLPEQLPLAPPIKEIERRVKARKKLPKTNS